MAYAAPESPFAHSHLRGVTALPSCAAVPRKPMCRQGLGGASVPPASILLPTLPPLSSDSRSDRHAWRPHRDGAIDRLDGGNFTVLRPCESGTKSRVSSLSTGDLFAVDRAAASTTKSALAAGESGD